MSSILDISIVVTILAMAFLLLLAVIGLLKAPFAARSARRMARGMGLDGDTYGRMCAVYSLHLFLPGEYFLGCVYDRAAPCRVTSRVFVFLYALWFLGPIAGGIELAGGYFQEYEKWAATRDYRISDFIIVWVMVAVPIPLNMLTLALTIVGVRRQYARDRSGRQGSQESALTPETYAKPLVTLGAAMVVYAVIASSISAFGGRDEDYPHVSNGIQVAMFFGVPIFLVIAPWIAWIRRIWWGNAVADGNVLLGLFIPAAYLRPFAYAFMWTVMTIWTGFAYWASYPF